MATALGACDKLFSLTQVPDAAVDARSIDGTPDTPIDAAVHDKGCADLSREGFADPAVYPDIAACAGAWQLPGLQQVVPMCAHRAGNDGSQLDGAGCSAADLCEETWHVCQTKLDVGTNMPVALRSCAGLGAEANMFFATGQGGAGGDCTANPTDDFLGCGTYGVAANSNCAPLDMTTNNMCTAFGGIGGWNCPVFNSELTTVTKAEPLIGGGVLCCRDPR